MFVGGSHISWLPVMNVASVHTRTSLLLRSQVASHIWSCPDEIWRSFSINIIFTGSLVLLRNAKNGLILRRPLDEWASPRRTCIKSSSPPPLPLTIPLPSCIRPHNIFLRVCTSQPHSSHSHLPHPHLSNLVGANQPLTATTHHRNQPCTHPHPLPTRARAPSRRPHHITTRRRLL